MDIAADIAVTVGDEWLPILYRDKVRSLRTRSLKIAIPVRENIAEIQYTLLGIELKVGKSRFACPDLATARYMRVFARIGCTEFAIPYDITKISAAADELETSWQQALLLLNEKIQDAAPRSRASTRSRLVKMMRSDLNEIGPGEVMPVFNRETRQNPR